ncbi:hypothetical protein DFR24_3314 [Panacagrimonas perspica]|uniref:CDP-glycerol glycerophosphotransferase (TagB/SpsB family) n=1 Tax=Panacagrimonas perspica TaxID=381431 RepID=A0A4R7P532_9GAMM|nr:sensor domain-containing protein [Panacagrimonas perspica]TDU28933.1 hypothetical protein DFR24_3314 [Panacagrimonas perspica]THD02245.1 hypothetical protein B1810_15050 [Panacagrimonas perspica]
MKVVFPYFGQLHQVFHSLPIAAQMAIRHPDVQVSAAGATSAHVDFIRDLLTQYAPAAPVNVEALERPLLDLSRTKKRTMLKNRAYLRGFDAIVTPERTSLFMRLLGLGGTRLIWTRHGAGDRAIGFAKDVNRFDYVLLAGRKIEERLLSAGLIRPGHYTSGIYAKFDWLQTRGTQRRWFDNDRPTVLYNPHFEPGLSSWPEHGMAVLDFFAASDRYNLIFAPHVRLFDPPTPDKYRAFERFANVPHLRIDLGSVHGIDMSYVDAVDLYLGDVSSQVAEFVARPRPCVFLNSHRVAWRDSPDYAFWTLGPVIDDVEALPQALEDALERPEAFGAVQAAYVADTFGIEPGTASAARGADAIVDFLKRESAT